MNPIDKNDGISSQPYHNSQKSEASASEETKKTARLFHPDSDSTIEVTHVERSRIPFVSVNDISSFLKTALDGVKSSIKNIAEFFHTTAYEIKSFFCKKEIPLTTTDEFYKDVQGNDLKTDEGSKGLNHQSRIDFLRMPNLSTNSEGEPDRGIVYISGEAHSFEDIANAAETTTWEDYVTPSLKKLLPKEEDQRKAIVFLTQGALADATMFAQTAGGNDHVFAVSAFESRFYKKNGDVFLEREMMFLGKSTLSGEIEKSIPIKMTINFSDPSAPVKLLVFPVRNR